jgi:hypothetical protein
LYFTSTPYSNLTGVKCLTYIGTEGDGVEVPSATAGINNALNVTVVASNHVTAEFANVGTAATVNLTLTNTLGVGQMDLTVVPEVEPPAHGAPVIIRGVYAIQPNAGPSYFHASCPTGYSVISGGYRVSGFSIQVRMDFPSTATRWTVYAQHTLTYGGPGQVDVYAVCMPN